MISTHRTRTTWPLALVGVFSGLLLTAAVAHAQSQPRDFSAGLGAHLVTAMTQLCVTTGDSSHCEVLHPFAGLALEAQVWPLSFAGIGLRAAASTSLGAMESTSHFGEGEERDQLLLRFELEGVLVPPFLPQGLWLSAGLGLLRLDDSLDDLDDGGHVVRSSSATNSGWLVGAAIHWDLSPRAQVTPALALRVELLSLGDPPALADAVESVDFGTAPWVELELSLRIAD